MFRFTNCSIIHLSIVAGLVVRHGDLSHEITLSHEGRRPECDNVSLPSTYLPTFHFVTTQTCFEGAISC